MGVFNGSPVRIPVQRLVTASVLGHGQRSIEKERPHPFIS